MKKSTNGGLVKAYRNEAFLNSANARTIRILAEYLEPLHRLRRHRIKDTIVFYGSARVPSQQQAEENLARLNRQSGNERDPSLDRARRAAQQDLQASRYYEDARELAYRLTKWSLALKENQRFIVCSGGGPGIMEAANRGASEAGGPTIGMNISIPYEQSANPYLTRNLSFEFHYFFMRKFWFVFLAKALVVFPGGFGTMDELFELLTLRQTRKVTKPLSVIVYGEEFWRDIINFDKMVSWGVISPEDLELFHLVDSVDSAFNLLRDHFEKAFIGKKRYWHW